MPSAAPPVRAEVCVHRCGSRCWAVGLGRPGTTHPSSLARWLARWRVAEAPAGLWAGWRPGPELWSQRARGPEGLRSHREVPGALPGDHTAHAAGLPSPSLGEKHRTPPARDPSPPPSVAR